MQNRRLILGTWIIVTKRKGECMGTIFSRLIKQGVDAC